MERLSRRGECFVYDNAVPLVSGFALGNRWSRYYAYTQDGYLQLLQRFEDQKISLTVATLDTDRHWSKMLDEVKKITKLDRNTEFTEETTVGRVTAGIQICFPIIRNYSKISKSIICNTKFHEKPYSILVFKIKPCVDA